MGYVSLATARQAVKPIVRPNTQMGALRVRDDAEGLLRAADALREGHVVIFPTDTVYGVGAAADRDEACQRLFELKGRATTKAIPILVATAADLEQVVESIPGSARKLMRRFWPGGLTIVFRRHPSFRSAALAGGDTVAVRIPDDLRARALINAAGGLLAATSANASGRPSPVTADDAALQLPAVDVVVDGGPCPGGVESTVVDVTTDPPRILREGAIPARQVEAVLRDP
jgi:L-threonylcarbamoyladenylate synthase